VFLDFDEATIAKQRLDVARVKLRTVRRGMIDTVLQLKVVNDVFDVWVVEERCACGDDRSVETEEGYRSLQKINSESGEHGWKGDDRDLFSDGRSDSDTSEAGKEVLGLQLGGSMQSVAEPSMGVRQIDLESQNNISRNVLESLSGVPVDGGQVGEEGEFLDQSPRSEAGVGMSEVRGEGVGPGEEVANTLLSDGALLADHVRVDPTLVEVDEKSGPNGPDPGVNMDLGLEDQEERVLDPTLVNGHLADIDVMKDVEVMGVDDVAAEGGNNIMRTSQISESSSDSTQSNGGLALIKKSKKGPNNKPCRPAPPMVGIPKFRQLELVLKAAVGRCNKHGGASHSRAGDPSIQEIQAESVQEVVEEEQQVKTARLGSGLQYLMDGEWGFIPETNSEGDGNAVSKEDEAKILVVIQKEVGFNFEANDEEIQSKLVELDNNDRMKNVEQVPERGD
jgi:hypothetical protein